MRVKGMGRKNKKIISRIIKSRRELRKRERINMKNWVGEECEDGRISEKRVGIAFFSDFLYFFCSLLVREYNVISKLQCLLLLGKMLRWERLGVFLGFHCRLKET